MQHSTKILSSLASFLLSTNLIAAEVASAPNGLELPENYQDWKVISQSHRLDNNTLRIITGNDAAITASRNDKTDP